MTVIAATTLRVSPRDEVRWRLAQDLFTHVVSSSCAVFGVRKQIDHPGLRTHRSRGRRARWPDGPRVL